MSAIKKIGADFENIIGTMPGSYAYTMLNGDVYSVPYEIPRDKAYDAIQAHIAEQGKLAPTDAVNPDPRDRFAVLFNEMTAADEKAASRRYSLRQQLIAFADTLADDTTYTKEIRDFAQIAKYYILRGAE